MMAAVVCFGSSAAWAQGLSGSNVNVGLYVSGDYIDANHGSTGTDPNSLFLDPDGDPLCSLAVVDGSSLDFFNTYFGTYMTLTFTSAGFTLTNLIPDPFPAANFLGLKIDVLLGPAPGAIAIDEAASAADSGRASSPARQPIRSASIWRAFARIPAAPSPTMSSSTLHLQPYPSPPAGR